MPNENNCNDHCIKPAKRFRSNKKQSTTIKKKLSTKKIMRRA